MNVYYSIEIFQFVLLQPGTEVDIWDVMSLNKIVHIIEMTWVRIELSSD